MNDFEWARYTTDEYIPKVGDRVRCKSGFDEVFFGPESTWGGLGYVCDMEFTISRITEKNDGPLVVLWPDRGDGVYLQAVEFVSDEV